MSYRHCSMNIGGHNTYVSLDRACLSSVGCRDGSDRSHRGAGVAGSSAFAAGFGLTSGVRCVRSRIRAGRCGRRADTIAPDNNGRDVR